MSDWYTIFFEIAPATNQGCSLAGIGLLDLILVFGIDLGPLQLHGGGEEPVVGGPLIGHQDDGLDDLNVLQVGLLGCLHYPCQHELLCCLGGQQMFQIIVRDFLYMCEREREI